MDLLYVILENFKTPPLEKGESERPPAGEAGSEQGDLKSVK